MITLGIDIGGSSIKAALRQDAQTLWTHRSRTYAKPSSDELREVLIAVAREAGTYLANMPMIGVQRPPVACIGIAAPGLLDASGLRVARSLNMPGLVGLDLGDAVHAGLHTREGTAGERALPFVVVSDAYAAAVDVHASEALHGRLVALSLGTGVGASVLDDGVPVRLTGPGPGHLGAIDVSLSDDADPHALAADGSIGTLEGYIGLAALRARYGEIDEALLTRLGPADAPIRALCRALRVIHAVYRPEHVRLLGGVGVRLAGAVPALHAEVCRGLTSLARPGWTLAVGTSDFHAACGAARLAAQSHAGAMGPPASE